MEWLGLKLNGIFGEDCATSLCLWFMGQSCADDGEDVACVWGSQLQLEAESQEEGDTKRGGGAPSGTPSRDPSAPPTSPVRPTGKGILTGK
eukprot:8151380-Pyramimonas_sp.AAC.1